MTGAGVNVVLVGAVLLLLAVCALMGIGLLVTSGDLEQSRGEVAQLEAELAAAREDARRTADERDVAVAGSPPASSPPPAQADLWADVEAIFRPRPDSAGTDS